MKITHVISSPASGGAEIYVKDLSIAMSKLGHEVHILFLSNAKDIGRDTLFEKRFLADLNEANVQFSFIGNKARKNPFFGISKLKQHIAHFSPDILHCHLYFALIFSLFTKSVKVIYTHHNIKLNIPRIAYKIFDLKVSSYIGICQACTHMLTGLTNKSVVNINNAVSENRLKPKSEYLDNSIPVILMVGHLSEQKNYKLLFDVVNLLPECQFVIKIAGEGPEFSDFSAKIKKYGLESKIKLLGNVNNIAEQMNEADIFAMTSSWEGLPISLIEATLTGLPTIVTNVGGCAEVAHSALNGFVIDSFSPEAYADKLSLLLNSYSLRTFLSANSLENSKSYTLESSVHSHLNLYAS